MGRFSLISLLMLHNRVMEVPANMVRGRLPREPCSYRLADSGVARCHLCGKVFFEDLVTQQNVHVKEL